ncbi:MAG: hypothetical protein WAT71_05355 [Ignavibacteria bacterium]
MKLIKYILIALFVTTSLQAQNVKITDFDIPVSSARKFLINGFYNWAQTDPNDTILNLTSSWQLDGAYTQFYTSPSYAWHLNLVGSLNQLTREDTTRYNYNIATDLSKYFSDSKGWFGNSEVSSNFARKREFGTDNRPTIDIFAGLGYGRQVNATSLAKAVRIDEDLRKGGITNKYMPRATVLAIAQIVDRESEYRDKYKSLYESKIIEDISTEVMNSGVTNSTNMSALGFMRIRNVLYGLNQFINDRTYGGDIRLGVSYQVLTRNKELTGAPAFLSMRGRYGYPIGLNHQLSAFFTAGTALDSAFGSLFTGNAGFGYSYNMTNRISFNAGYVVTFNQIFDQNNISLVGVPFGTDKSGGDNTATAGFTFYIENYITLNLTGGYSTIYGTEQRWFSNASMGLIVF